MTLSSPHFWSFKTIRILLSVMRQVFEGQQHFSKMAKGENYISDKTCGTGGGKDDERETPCWNSYYHPSPPPIYQKRSLAHLTPSHPTKPNPSNSQNRINVRLQVLDTRRGPMSWWWFCYPKLWVFFMFYILCETVRRCPVSTLLNKKWWPAWNSRSISA